MLKGRNSIDDRHERYQFWLIFVVIIFFIPLSVSYVFIFSFIGLEVSEQSPIIVITAGSIIILYLFLASLYQEIINNTMSDESTNLANFSVMLFGFDVLSYVSIYLSLSIKEFLLAPFLYLISIPIATFLYFMLKDSPDLRNPFKILGLVLLIVPTFLRLGNINLLGQLFQNVFWHIGTPIGVSLTISGFLFSFTD